MDGRCAEMCRGFGHCTPLPSFPAVRSKPAKFEQLAPDVGALRFEFHSEACAEGIVVLQCGI